MKSALNTLAYLKGAMYITQSTDFKNIVDVLMSEGDEVLNYVKGIAFDGVELLRQRLYLDKEQLACVLTEEGNRIKAWFWSMNMDLKLHCVIHTQFHVIFFWMGLYVIGEIVKIIVIGTF